MGGERKNEQNFVYGVLFVGELFGEGGKIWEEEDR
jgi:hypothetical protein